MMKRLVALLLSILLVVSMLPGFVYAEVATSTDIHASGVDVSPLEKALLSGETVFVRTKGEAQLYATGAYGKEESLLGTVNGWVRVSGISGKRVNVQFTDAEGASLKGVMGLKHLDRNNPVVGTDALSSIGDSRIMMQNGTIVGTAVFTAKSIENRTQSVQESVVEDVTESEDAE